MLRLTRPFLECMSTRTHAGRGRSLIADDAVCVQANLASSLELIRYSLALI